MPASSAYKRMKRALLAQVNLIPKGRVAETGNLAASVNIPARHAAYILSQLTDEERTVVAWHRAVPPAGKFAKARLKDPRTQLQIKLLERDGLTLDANGAILNWPAPAWTPPDTHSSTIWADEDDDL